MTRKEMKEVLINKIEVIRFTKNDSEKSKHLAHIAFWYDEKFEEVPEDYLIEYTFREESIEGVAGITQQELNNQPSWSIDQWEDFSDAELKEFIELFEV